MFSMGTPREPKPVKLFVALLSSEETLLSRVERDLAELFGAVELASAALPWSVTDYYAAEMGSGLLRRFIAFASLIAPDRLPEIKLGAQGLEERYQRIDGGRKRRRVNIDPGYLDAGKVALASTKEAPHRLYLGSGIYGEITLLYQNGSFQPLPRTYPDYTWPDTGAFLAACRARYLEQLNARA